MTFLCICTVYIYIYILPGPWAALVPHASNVTTITSRAWWWCFTPYPVCSVYFQILKNSLSVSYDTYTVNRYDQYPPIWPISSSKQITYLMTLAFSIARILSSTAQLISTEEYITFEEWVPQDITDDSDPLRQQHETVEIHGIPPPKRIKHIWKKQTKAKFQFTQRIFEWAPDTFRHHHLESVQREQLKIHVQSITPTNLEQQSDYYDRSKAVFFVLFAQSIFGITNLVESLVSHILV